MAIFFAEETNKRTAARQARILDYLMIHCTVQASNIVSHGNFAQFLARSVAPLCPVGTKHRLTNILGCTKDEQKQFANINLFLNIHSHSSSVGHVLMLASDLRK
jgi:hypothetical protein